MLNIETKKKVVGKKIVKFGIEKDNGKQFRQKLQYRIHKPTSQNHQDAWFASVSANKGLVNQIV